MDLCDAAVLNSNVSGLPEPPEVQQVHDEREGEAALLAEGIGLREPLNANEALQVHAGAHGRRASPGVDQPALQRHPQRVRLRQHQSHGSRGSGPHQGLPCLRLFFSLSRPSVLKGQN